MLQGLVDFDGYYLESDPCLVCNNPEVPFQVNFFSRLYLIQLKMNMHIVFLVTFLMNQNFVSIEQMSKIFIFILFIDFYKES